MSNLPPSEKPPTRAERLMQAALTAERSFVDNGAAAPTATPPAPRGRPKSGARARALNRRIREVLREQEAEVFAKTGKEPPAPEATAFGEPEPGAADLAAPDYGAAEFGDSEYGAPVIPAPGLPPLGRNGRPRPASSGSSWEDVANEVVPNGMARPRGLATGAMRGGSRPNPASYGAHPRWMAQPEAPRAILCDLPGPHEPLTAALRGQEFYCERNGIHLMISRDAADYDDVFINLRDRLCKALEKECFVALSGAAVEDLLFVDIETAGLSSSQPLFLIGALRMDGTPRLNLFLARDYPEEKAALAAFHQVARGKRLITFNGKSFDWPYIEGRSITYRLDFERPAAHFDLLHFARKTWKHSLPNCKLQTLELYLCGRNRIDDVPGSQIPAAYHEFVATHAATGAGAHLMAPILHHNALDILTMAELVCKAGEEAN